MSMRSLKVKAKSEKRKSFNFYILRLTFLAITFTFYTLSFTFAYAAHGCLECDQGNFRHSGASECDSTPECKTDNSTASGTCQGSDDLIGQTCDSDFTPAPPLATTSNPSDLTPDEKAVIAQNKGLLPNEIVTGIEPKDATLYSPNLFTEILKRFQSLTDYIFSIFGFNPVEKEEFASNTEVQRQAEIPILPSPSPNSNAVTENKEELKLLYGTTVPDEINKDSQKAKDYEQNWEKSYLPKGVSIFDKK